MITFDLMKLETNILHQFVGFCIMKVMAVSLKTLQLYYDIRACYYDVITIFVPQYRQLLRWPIPQTWHLCNSTIVFYFSQMKVGVLLYIFSMYHKPLRSIFHGKKWKSSVKTCGFPYIPYVQKGICVRPGGAPSGHVYLTLSRG
jgi:hypothetical protein